MHSERNKKENIANTSSVFDSYFLCGRNDRDFFTFYGENNEQIIKLQLSGFGNILGAQKMEILVSVGMIIFAIAFFYLYFLASAILFCDAPVSLIGALFSFFCLCPIGRHKIHIGREMKYRWADCISEVNPLYVAGFFRKSASDKNILSNLKMNFLHISGNRN